MPRKLKVYQTSKGFYDLAIAAPSMKAALEAWGSSNNSFHQGFAKESDDDDVISATMAKPGVVLRRPVGSSNRFKEHSEMPTAASLGASLENEAPSKKNAPTKKKAKRTKSTKADIKAERAAAAAFEKEVRKRELQRRKEEAKAAKALDRRKAAMAKAETALAEARAKHEERSATIDRDREVVERRAAAEDDRWKKLEASLKDALRDAGC